MTEEYSAVYRQLDAIGKKAANIHIKGLGEDIIVALKDLAMQNHDPEKG